MFLCLFCVGWLHRSPTTYAKPITDISNICQTPLGKFNSNEFSDEFNNNELLIKKMIAEIQINQC